MVEDREGRAVPGRADEEAAEQGGGVEVLEDEGEDGLRCPDPMRFDACCSLKGRSFDGQAHARGPELGRSRSERGSGRGFGLTSLRLLDHCRARSVKLISLTSWITSPGR